MTFLRGSGEKSLSGKVTRLPVTYTTRDFARRARSGREQFAHPVPQTSLCCPCSLPVSAVCYTLSWSSVTGFVSSKSLPCFPQQNRMSGFAFPEVGPLGIGSPLSQPEFWPSVICVAKTAVCPSRHTSLVAGVSIPCLLLCFVSRFRFPCREKQPARAWAW